MAKLISHLSSKITFKVLKEEKEFFVVIKTDEPDIKLRLEKHAVDGKMFKINNRIRGKKVKNKSN